MLNFLAGFDAPLSLRDTDGHTPLYYAKQQGSGVMAKALMELLGEAAAKEVSTSIMHHATHITRSIATQTINTFT